MPFYKLGRKEIEERRGNQGKYREEIRWYCVMTHFRQEKNVCAAIQRKFPPPGCIEVLLPMVGSESPDSPKKNTLGTFLFTGCIFIRCLMTEDIYMGITSLKGVFSILGDAFRIPTMMDGREMATLKEMLSFVPAPILADWPKSSVNVVVTSGNLAGLQGRIIDDHEKYPRVAFRLSFIGTESAIVVALPRAQIRIQEANNVEAAAPRSLTE